LGLRNVDAKVGHRHRRRTGEPNEIRDTVLREDEEEEEEDLPISKLLEIPECNTLSSDRKDRHD